MIGSSRAMERVYQLVEMVANRDTTVLVTGETGTGKELVAGAVHALSKRAKHPFVVVNCAAIPEALLEAELFGHARGAFTGAVQSRLGRIHVAQGGTLFLDEVGELPLSMQAKLLRFLQSGEVQRLGSSDVYRVDVRVVCATNVKLLELTRARQFRLDLYYRLAIFPVVIPPLRERMEDVRPLTEHFLEKLSAEGAMPRKYLSADALAYLGKAEWPGNVRELQHAIERAFILAGNDLTLGVEHFSRLANTTTKENFSSAVRCWQASCSHVSRDQPTHRPSTAAAHAAAASAESGSACCGARKLGARVCDVHAGGGVAGKIVYAAAAEVSRLHLELQRTNSELERSLEENARMRSYLTRVVESLPCGVLVVNASGTLQIINPEARRLFGTPVEWVLGDGTRPPKAFANAIDGLPMKAFVTEHEMLIQNGTETRSVGVLRTSLQDRMDGTGDTVWIVRDLTEQKRIAEERETARKSLALAEIATVLAHEIRNPLGSMELFTGLLADATAHLPETRQWITHLQAGLRALSATMTNVVDVSASIICVKTRFRLANALSFERFVVSGIRSAESRPSRARLPRHPQAASPSFKQSLPV